MKVFIPTTRLRLFEPLLYSYFWPMSDYDFVIVGAGASGLLLANAMGKDSFFADSSILVLEKERKTQNDRTWCFWEKGPGAFDTLLAKSWPKIHFAGQNLELTTKISPYTYKMIRGEDFYNRYLGLLKGYRNITVMYTEVISINENSFGAEVVTNNGTYKTKQVFNSIFDYSTIIAQKRYPVLQQHFLGWFVTTEKPIFNVDVATFMDFSIPQQGNTRFMYVLPFAENKALVEYTLFSANTLPKKDYEDAIANYLLEHKAGRYEITEVEQGNIPMTCYDFSQLNSKHIFNIGIAGGWAKASTGYTFMSTTKKVKALVAHIKKGKKPNQLKTKNKFWYYDLLLLDILYHNNHLGSDIFESLFKKIAPQHVFQFLDEDTTILEDVKIMSAPKPLPFIKALLKRVF